MTAIKWDDFPRILDEVVAEKGEDYVYERVASMHPGGSCRYRADDAPSCLIGHVLDRMGVPYDSKWEGTSAYGVIYRDLAGPEEIANAASIAQDAQDSGQPWSQARSSFHTLLGERREEMAGEESE